MSLRRIPKTTTLPILQGAIRGKRWIVGASNHGCWLGSYEYEKRILFEQLVQPGHTVFDIGAHVGFYSLLASHLVGADGRVFAFEPLPRNLHFLREHLRLNDVNNVIVSDAAVCAQDGRAGFNEESGESKLRGHLDVRGPIQVRTVALDTLRANGELPLPDCMKIDVEGAELEVLQGASGLLQEARPTLFVATHSYELNRACRAFLTELSYQSRRIGPIVHDSLDEILASPN